VILSSIGASNLKGQTFELPLSKAVAIIGPNFSGKTAIIEAIRLALIGYIPEVGKRTQATWGLSSGPDMAVVARFSDGEEIRRRFYMKGPTIAVENDGISFDLPLLHPDYYFGLTDTDRTNYVFSRIRLPEIYSVDSIMAELQNVNLEEGHTEAVEKAKRIVVRELNERCFAGATVLQEPIEKAVELLREKYTYWNRRAKETQGAVTTLTELKTREKVSAAPADIDGQIAQAQKDLAAINEEKGRLTAERDAAERAAGRRQNLQRELDKDRIDYPRMLTQKQEEKEALEKQLVPEPDAEEIEQTRRTIANATQTINGADADVGIADKAIGEVDARLKEIAHLKACPYCKAKGTGWKKTLEGELKERKTNAEQAIRAATKRRDTANDRLRDANETLETLLRAQESNHRLREQIRQLEREIGNIQTDQRAEKEKRDRYQAEIDEIGKTADVKKLNQQIAFAEEKRVGAATRLSELNGLKQTETRYQQDLLRATEAEQEHQDAKANLAVVKRFAETLKDKKEAMICEAFTKLMQVANLFTKSILKSPLVLHQNVIGRFEGSKFVPHDTFSGTEKALTYIAIATALSADAPLRLVLLDEIGRLDVTNQGAVINRLLNLVNEGVIDQFILVGTDLHQIGTWKDLQVVEVGK
jgi:DNA repair exonuclease SbcCD ATPase subunit